MTDALVVRGGTVIHDGRVERADVLIRDGVIAQVGPTVDAPAGAREIDASGCWVGPGFVDLHAHLREPGYTESETVLTGARAAAVGGYSCIVAMPNTEPAIDSAILADHVLTLGRAAPVAVAVAGAITVGRRGEALAPIAEMAALGVRIFTDDGAGVADASLLRRAMRYAAPLGVRVAEHCEDATLTAGGAMNEGALSSRLGLGGRPALAEELMVWRDIQLAADTGCPLHLLHLSTAAAVEMAVAARRRGVPVTFEVAPHHFTLDEGECAGFDPRFKVHPPLRTPEDVAALRAALSAGDVDAVATDHAPHAPHLKDLPFDEAPPGMLGLEHAASLTLDVLGDDCLGFFQVMSRGPAAIAGLTADADAAQGAHGGTVATGEDANVVVFDPAVRYVVDEMALHSRSTNTPYHGRALRGRARHLVVRGQLSLCDGELA